MNEHVDNLIFWNRRLLSFGGMWPLEATPIKFYIWFLYSMIHLGLGFADLAQIFGNLELMVENFTETLFQVMITAKIIVVRYSSSLRTLLGNYASNSDVDIYKNDDERRAYMIYAETGLKVFKLFIWITIASLTVHYVTPLANYVQAALLGGTSPFILPYRLRLFFNVSDVRTYILVYAYEGPIIYIYLCFTTIACFMASLILNVCGQLSVLAFRIRNLNATDDQLHNELCAIVKKHKELIVTTNAIDGIFNLVLLDEFIICTGILGLCMYNLLMNFDSADAPVILGFLLYGFGMLIGIYGFCVAGDCLIEESFNVHDSYYECDWYRMPPQCQKLIIICIIRAGTPLQITGGGLYIYCLETFTAMVKSAMAYVSMLRQLA